MAELLRRGAELADARLPAWLYHRMSVSPERVRAGLRARGLRFHDPEGPPLRRGELRDTAERMVRNAQASAVGLGAVGGIGGLLSVAPEAVGWVFLLVRLGQRLVVAYGFDPRTPRGDAALARVLAAAFQVELPTSGVVGTRATALLRVRPQGGEGARARLVRSVGLKAARLATGRLGRLVPVVSSAVSAHGNREELAAAGARMIDVLERLAEDPGPAPGDAVDAIEVWRGPR